jgi:predicted SAM-dependent methyltransferase
MNRIICAICLNKLKNIYSLENVPITLSCTETPNLFFSELSVSQCECCNTIQLDKLIPLDILYSESHNYTSVGKTWEEYFNLFCTSIENIIINKNILEIGDPSGKIANRLDSYNKWYIVEPNKNVNINFNKKIEFIEDFFDENFNTNKKIDIIIHSHLFEHIYEPNVFLKKCYSTLNDDGEMFFGVPNMEYIALNKVAPFLGIFFEHTIFLNKTNISYLLESNGFEIVKIIDYCNHSTLYHVKKGNIIKKDISIFNYNNLFFKTLNDYHFFINSCNEILKSAENNVYVFGASYNTQFLLTLGLNLNKIKGILDNCKEKQSKYLYGYNLQIFSPEIVQDSNSIVILKNGYYSDEIRNQLLNINPNTIILN